MEVEGSGNGHFIPVRNEQDLLQEKERESTLFVMQLNCFKGKEAIALAVASQEHKYSHPVYYKGNVCFPKLIPKPIQDDNDEDYDDEDQVSQEDVERNKNLSLNLNLSQEEDDDDETFSVDLQSLLSQQHQNRVKRQDHFSSHRFRSRIPPYHSSYFTAPLTGASSPSIPLTRTKQKIKLSRALDMVETYKLQGCVARTICQLACDPTIFGKTGQSMAAVMYRINSHSKIPGVSEEKASFYREAISSGEVIRENEDDCTSTCTQRYTPCSMATPVILRMASNFDLSV